MDGGRFLYAKCLQTSGLGDLVHANRVYTGQSQQSCHGTISLCSCQDNDGACDTYTVVEVRTRYPKTCLFGIRIVWH